LHRVDAANYGPLVINKSLTIDCRDACAAAQGCGFADSVTRTWYASRAIPRCSPWSGDYANVLGAILDRKRRR
jgi:hypothetical protein